MSSHESPAAPVHERPGDDQPELQRAWDRLHDAGFVRSSDDEPPICEAEAQHASSTVGRTSAMVMRGTPTDALKVRRLLDEVAARLPNDELGHALYRWTEEVTRLVEGSD